MNDKPRHPLDTFTRLADGVLNVLDLLTGHAPDPDLDDRRAVYAHVAAFLAERLGCSAAAARAAVHRLCGEPDETLLAEGRSCDPALLEQVQALLLGVRVDYRFENARQAERVTAVAFLHGEHPARHRVVETLDWDILPSEVRSERLRHGAAHVAFQLYPRGDAANP